MAQADFNVAELIRRLGLTDKPGLAFAIRETIQPTINVGDLANLTPALRPPAGLAGSSLAAGAGGTFNLMFVHSLDPGGCYCWFGRAVAELRVNIFQGAPGVAGIVAPYSVEGLVAPRSVVTTVLQNVGSIVGANNPIFRDGAIELGTNGIYLARGQSIVQQAISGGVGTFCVRVVAIPASEGGNVGAP